MGAARKKPPFSASVVPSAMRPTCRAMHSSAPASSSRWRWSSSASRENTRSGTQYRIDYRAWHVDLGIDPENIRLYEHPKE